MKRSYLIIYCALLFAITAFSYSRLSFDTALGAHVNYALYHLAPLTAVVWGFFAAKRYGLQNIHGSSLALITMGIAAWMLGDLMSNGSCFGWGGDIFDLVTNIIYLSGYPFIFAGLFRELKFSGIQWNGSKIIYALLLSFMFILSASLLAANNIHSNGQNLDTVMNILYVAGDALLAVLAVFVLLMALEYQKGRMFAPWLYIFCGVFFTYIADILYSFHEAKYEQGLALFRSIDLIYVLSYLFFAYGFFRLDFLILEAQKKLK